MIFLFNFLFSHSLIAVSKNPNQLYKTRSLFQKFKNAQKIPEKGEGEKKN